MRTRSREELTALYGDPIGWNGTNPWYRVGDREIEFGYVATCGGWRPTGLEGMVQQPPRRSIMRRVEAAR